MTSILNALSTLQSSVSMRNNIAKTTADMAEASQEVSTGLRANVYADLGQGSAITLALRAQMARTQGLSDANTLLSNKMDVMSTALGTVHDSAQSVLSQAVANLADPGADAATLQQSAKAALEQITSALNTNYGGEYLFSGTASDTTPLQNHDSTNSATGLSPDEVAAGIVGSGPTSAAEADAMAAQFDALFASSTGTSADFEATFYNGTPATDASGAANARIVGQIDDDTTVGYGVQANDPALRGILQGLTMLASTDVSQISDPDAYASWMNAAVSALSGGVDGVTQVQAVLGSQQQLVTQTQARQDDLVSVYTSRIADYESVDAYDAATRLTELQTQLNASYAATTTILNMSILDYL